VAARHRQLVLWMRQASMAASRFRHAGTELADSATPPSEQRRAAHHQQPCSRPAMALPPVRRCTSAIHHVSAGHQQQPSQREWRPRVGAGACACPRGSAPWAAHPRMFSLSHASDGGSGATLLLESKAPTAAKLGVAPLTGPQLSRQPRPLHSDPRRSPCHATSCAVSATAQPQTMPCAHHHGRLFVHQLTSVVHACVRLQSESNASSRLLRPPPPPPAPIRRSLARRLLQQPLARR
jgi:hypothetical protein